MRAASQGRRLRPARPPCAHSTVVRRQRPGRHARRAPAPRAETTLVGEDPFAVLDLDSSASEKEIRAAHRRLVKRWHPDRNPGDDTAAEQFQKVQAAKVILTTPELRSAYERGGLDAITDSTIESVQTIDPSELGWLGSAVCSFTRDSGAFRTVVNPMLLEAAKLGAVDTEPLDWGAPTTGRVDKGAAVFYVLNVSKAAAKEGFVLSATTRKGQVKLLVWEAGDGVEEFWRVVAQAEAEGVPGGRCASLLQAQGRVLGGVPFSMEEHLRATTASPDVGPEDVYNALDGAQQREPLRLRPGIHLLGVYGDHFFGKCKYTLLAEKHDARAQAALEAADAALLAKKREVEPRRREWERVRKEYEAYVERAEADTQEMAELLNARAALYGDFVGAQKALGHDREAEAREGGGGLLGGLFGGGRR